MGHSILPFSGANRWVNCPGSALRESQLPDLDTAAAMEGTAVHWVIENLIPKMLRNEDITGKEYLDKVCPINGVIITDEMIQSASFYVEYVQQIMRTYSIFNADHLHVEETISGSIIHNECYGTPDLIIDTIHKDNTIYSIDHKHGHSPVHALENWQTLIGAVSKLSQLENVNNDTRIVNIVIQPRSFKPQGPIDKWEITVGELEPYIQKARVAAIEALKPNAPCKSGPWCKHCKAILTCGTNTIETMSMIDYLDSFAGQQDLTNQALGLKLTILDKVLERTNQLHDALSTHVETLVEDGENVPGWEMGRKRGSTIWNIPDEEVQTLGMLYGVDLTESKTSSPNQAKGKKIPQAVIDAQTKKIPGSKTLKKSDSTLAKSVFAKLKPMEIFKS